MTNLNAGSKRVGTSCSAPVALLPPSLPPSSLLTYRQINTGALSLSGATFVPFTNPPAASTRCFSLSSSGLWSKERGRACRESGAEESLSSRLGEREGEGGREGGKEGGNERSEDPKEGRSPLLASELFHQLCLFIPPLPPSLPPYLPSFLASSTARLSPRLAHATRDGVTRHMTAVLPLESEGGGEGGREGKIKMYFS